MREYRINLIDGIRPMERAEIIELPQEKPTAQSVNKVGQFFFRFSVVLLVIIIIFSANTALTSQGLMNNFGRLSFWQGVARLALGKDKILKGELSDRVNILILGMGGADHEGPYLTDTIILASFKPSTKELVLFSIPRDLYVPTADFGWQKINAVNSIGMIRSNDGAVLTSETINQIFNISIHYWMRVDFAAFKDLIDKIGGVEVNVERSFSDSQFPGPNYTFRVVHFDAGPQIMDGERALQFVRSRHGDNDESTDFARMKRQQKVILAIKNKIEKENFLVSTPKLWEMFNVFNDKITTNLNFTEMARLAKILNNIQEDKIKNYTFKAGPNGLLIPEIALNGAYILKPKDGSFQQMAQIMQNAFSENMPAANQEQKTLPTPAPSPAAGTKLIILNGTPINGLAQQTKQKLEPLGYPVNRVGNAPTRDRQKTIIYYYQDTNEKIINDLKAALQAEAVIIPDALQYLTSGTKNILIIVGASS